MNTTRPQTTGLPGHSSDQRMVLRLMMALVLVAAVPARAGIPGAGQTAPEDTPRSAPRTMPALQQPVAVYNNWSAYDELSDKVELTEELALRQLREILRLRRSGVRMDYYLMDAFWYDPRGGYRTFRQPHWPNGPDRWLAECRAADLRPGLWFSCNTLSQLEAIPEWENSLSGDGRALCLFEGGYLPHLMATLQMWYDRGVRLFKFDFANFSAATPAAAARLTGPQIVEANSQAFRDALQAFRARNSDALFTAFNGFGGRMDGTFHPVEQTVDRRWLEVFDALYCGDPRPADVPLFNFWRSKDVYSDHMVRYYEANGIPLERIDNTGFMVGTTGTCYHRGTEAWEGMLILEHARGGWLNQYYGNLELLDRPEAIWFAKVQRLFFPLLAAGATTTFGGWPGHGRPYGFVNASADGAVCTVVNPSQSFAVLELPEAAFRGARSPRARILFSDAGAKPKLTGRQIRLGPEALAVIGVGDYAQAKWNLGTGKDLRIPSAIEPLPLTQLHSTAQLVQGEVRVPKGMLLRILLRQTRQGTPYRLSGGAPPTGTPLDQLLRLEVRQAARVLPVRTQYGKAIWSGLSWASGEVAAAQLDPAQPVLVIGQSSAGEPLELQLECFGIRP